MNLLMTLDVVRFELKRSLTIGRGAIWFALVMFPIAIAVAIRVISMLADATINPDQWGLILYGLVPEVICLLGLLLWATPAISTEVESQTWIYLAMRKSGRTWVVLGKYLTSVVWTSSAAVVSATGCVLVLASASGFRLWAVMLALSLLSCVAHAALYMLIGVIFFRRTMVAAVAYTLLIEYGLSMVPAMANKFTINYRLRGLGAEWMDSDVMRSAAEELFGTEPAWMHLLVLAALTVSFLVVILIRVGQSEFPTQQDG